MAVSNVHYDFYVFSRLNYENKASSKVALPGLDHEDGILAPHLNNIDSGRSRW